MRKFLVLLLVATMGLVACNKDEDLTVTLVQNGKLALTLVDDEGNFIPGAEVKLFQGSGELDAMVSGEEGSVDFGTLNVGTYYVTVEAELDNKEYEFSKAVQVVTGATKQYEVNVENYVGDVSLQIKNSSTGEDLEFSGMKTILVKKNDEYENAEGLSELINLAIDALETDANGEVLYEEVPVGIYAIIFHDDDEVISSTSINVSKGDVSYPSLYANAMSVALSVKSSWNSCFRY